MDTTLLKNGLLALGCLVLLLLGTWKYNSTEPDQGGPFKSNGSFLENRHFLAYLPARNATGPRPLIVLFSPSADVAGMIRVWRDVAERHQWILLASKTFRNGIPWDVETYVYGEINWMVSKREFPFSIDPDRIVAAGLSGGGWGAHNFAFLYPKLISGVVINTGMMCPEYLYPQKSKYEAGKFAVFLASPTDFRYGEMTRDRHFLESVGWQTKWIEFEGGHTFAPPEAYAQAAQWIESRWNAR